MNMTDSDLTPRLDQLSLLLGKDVSFAEPDPEPTPAAETDDYEDEGLDVGYFVLGGFSDKTPKAASLAPASTVESPSSVAETSYSFSDYQKDDEMRKKAMAKRHEEAFDCSNFRPGEPLEQEARFCAWKLVTSYPSCYIGKTNRPRAKPFFDEILNDRTWDFFYLHDLKEAQKDPHLLIPTEQFEVFLEDLNDVLGTSLTIPPGTPGAKFFMKFGQGGTPRPRYLKRSETDSGLEIKTWPPLHPDDADGFWKASIQMQADWTDQMKIIKHGASSQNKASSERAARKKRDREKMMLAAQKYLGLKHDPVSLDVVFVCVDVEALELAPNPVSEVGLAILDTRLTKEVAPGPTAKEWFTFIETHHLRVREYKGLVNHRFVKGCPNRFDFGQSTFPTKSQLREAICSITNPFVADTRNIVLVGHDIAQDIKYVRSIGLDLLQIGGVVGQVDSQDLHQIWRNDTNGRGLHTVLSDLKIRSKNLHNAGNDAYYTLCAVVRIALEAAREEETKPKQIVDDSSVW